MLEHITTGEETAKKLLWEVKDGVQKSYMKNYWGWYEIQVQMDFHSRGKFKYIELKINLFTFQMFHDFFCHNFHGPYLTVFPPHHSTSPVLSFNQVTMMNH